MIALLRVRPGCRRSIIAGFVAWMIATAGVTPALAQTSIAFVQVNAATPQTNQAVVTAPYPAAQTAGNFNVVVVGWNDTSSQLTGVTDSAGNTYVKAIGPTVRSGLGQQSIYYAKNIAAAAAGANTVTVTFNVPARYVDLRIAEYSGIDNTTPLDVAVGANGTGSTSNSGSVTTINANNLLVGANLIGQGTIGPGTGYTSRIITTPDSDILEDRVVTTVGSYNATAAITGGPWIMQMVAFRAAGSPVDTQAPSVPGSLAATPASPTQVNLSWTASTDNVAVTGYRIERCLGASCTTFAQIGTATTTTYSDATAVASTIYNYRVRANDAAGNLSGYSNVAAGTTPAPPDTQAPTTPTSLVATAASSAQINLTWTASTDNVGVTLYLIERCQGAGCTTFAQIATSTGPAYNDGGLTASTTYRYRVRAGDAAGNRSAYSAISTATTPSVPDTQPPTAPSGLAASAASATRVNLTWTASTDNVGVTSYAIERCAGAACTTFAQIGTTGTPAYSDLGAMASTAYSYQVRALDGAGNASGYSNVASLTTPAPPDTQAPTVPAGLTASPASSSAIDLAWTASTDNVGVTTYLVERCQGAGCTTFAQIGTAVAPSYNDTGLAGSTTYRYRVRAGDAAGNRSAYSSIATAATPAVPDTTAPTAPAGLAASVVSGTQINLTWTASTDNVGVTGYRIERCSGTGCSGFAQVGTATSAVFGDSGLTAGTAYSYRVLATDAASNLSAYSNVASATTTAPDATPPSAPTNLSATAISNSQINLTWTAATDNVGVTNYLVEQCQGVGCGSFAQVGVAGGTSYSSTGLSGGTPYSYRVRATDAAANLSGYSATASATTAATPAIAFVQVNSAVPQTNQSTVTVPYTLAQSAGNLNVVAVGWNSPTGQVLSVTDIRGNNYVRAVGPTVHGSFATQSIYYAANIQSAAAGANAVTVTFAAAVPYADIRIAEYSGIAPTNPVDVVAAATGSGSLSNSGFATTTNPTDLIVGANMVTSFTSGPGTSFTSRVITVPDGDILEDRVVTSTGNYSATAPLSSGAWIMQMVAFKAGVATPDTTGPSAPSALTALAPSASQMSLTWTASTDDVGVTSYLIERCSGAACGNFVQVASATGTGYTDTGLTAGTSYGYRLRATDAAGNFSTYSNVATGTTQAPDTTPPSAPGLLTAVAVTGTQIDVSWGAATDNVGVIGYRLERCQGEGCTVFTKFGTTITSTTFSDTSLSINTSYSYIVRAEDADGNLGPYSNVASATTLSTNPNLVAAYSFDEGFGTNVSDLSGHNNNGTVANATWATQGKFGKALSFNGSNALVTIPDSPSLRLTTGMTLEAWVNPSVANWGWRDVIYKGNDNYYLEGATPNGPPMIGITVGSTQTEAHAATQLQPNTWTFLAATYDGTTLRFYINGTQVASQPRTGPIITSANPLQIGGDSIWGQFFQGMIDEVRVYSVALTPGQIQADMATAVGGASPAASLSTTNLNFGNQPVGTPSSPSPVTLTNGGTVTLNVGSVTISGAQGSDFAQTNNCVGALAPFASCTINLTFTPQNAGVRNASLAIADNAPGNPHSVVLSGTGTGFSITPQTTVLTPIQSQQFAVSGPGSGSVIWSVDGVPGGAAATGTVTPTGLYTPPAAAGTHTVTVATSDGTRSAASTVFVTAHNGVFTHHNDNQRTGQNLSETVLTPANVNATSFGKLASYTIDGIAHASPLYVANVNIPGVGPRNVVYVATEHDSVYAFDADAAGGAPLWKVSFINPGAGITTVPNGDVGECCDILPEIGITGTPVIDPSTGTLYVVVKTKEMGGYFQRLHALNIATGAEKLGGPVLIQASVPGTGAGSVGGTVTFNHLRENQRTALLLHNGVVYFGFGSHGDVQPYHGWLLGYDATTLQRVVAFNATPNGEGGGIWQSGAGLAIDTAGNFYFATGDGSFTADTGGVDYGNTFVKFNPITGVVDYFTPYNQASLDSNNLDLNAGGMVLLPDQPGAHPHLLISAGKDGTIYLVDRDNMGRFGATNNNVQTLANIFPFGTPLPGNYSSPVYFNGAVYFAPVADVVQMFRLSNGLLTTSPASTTPQAYAYPGGSLAISANGDAHGILWAVRKDGAGAGTLHAYDANNIATELYNSDQAGTRDQLDAAAKFSVPLVVNGRVFVATEGRFTVFGLLQ